MIRARMLLGEFVRDLHGNIAMMFGLFLFIILGAAGIAIDISRSTMVRTEIQESTDAALLAAARYKAGRPNADDDELTAVARKVFDASIKNDTVVNIDAFNISFDGDKGTFALDVDGTMDTLIMGMMGQKYIDIGARSEVKLGKPPLIEVAMALDVTGSMKGAKISALKSAAKDLVESLLEYEDADVKFGIVPFAQYVNVGKSNAGKTWISYPALWNGCVGSRDYPYNTKDIDYDAYPAKGVTVTSKGAALECPTALQPLIDDEDTLVKLINGLNASGNTFIPAGLTWAWSLLTPNAPFTEGLSFEELKSKNGTKALIVMTDGENTRAPTYPLHESPDQTLANSLTKELCVNIKADEIVVYSIAFDVSDTKIKDILEACATDSSHYFDAADADELSDAFASIASSLRNISLSK